MKAIKIGLPLAVALIMLTVCGLVTKGFQMPNPLLRDEVFSYPQVAAYRHDGGVFLIDNAFRRILGVNSEGIIDVLLKGGSKQEGQFFYAYDLETDVNGNLFVLNYVHDDYGMYLVREEIMHYNNHGKLISIPVQRTYDTLLPTRVQRGEIWGIRSDGNWLSWLILDESGIEAFRISIERQVLERIGKVQLQDAHILTADISWTGPKTVQANLKNGNFLNIDLANGTISEPFYLASGFPKSVPWEIVYTSSGTAYVNLPGKEIRLIPRNRPEESITILDPSILAEQGYPSDPYYYYRLSTSDNDQLITTNDEAVIIFDTQSRIHSYQTAASYSQKKIVFSWIIWALLIVGIIFLLFAIRQFYVLVMNKKISILLKQTFILVPIMAISMVIITTIITRDFLQRATAQEEMTIAGLTQAISQTVQGDLVQKISNINDYFSEPYMQLRSQLHAGINDNQDPWNRSYYFALYKVIDDVLYGMMYQNDRIGLFFPFTWYDEDQGVYRLAQAGEIATEKISDVSGQWLYAVGPVKNSEGEVVALLEIGTDLFNLNQSNNALFMQAMKVMALISMIIIIIVVILSFIILQSISIVKKGVSQISQGNWDYQINVKTNDEMNDLGQSFNSMSRSISQYLQEIEKMNNSYRRFFPEQFLTYLDIPSMTDARLGDQVLKTMTVFFSDIRSFTTFSEKMTPKENFDFLNQYLNMAAPIIRNNNGFIDKYMGDAIMALFPGRPDDAVAAAIQLNAALVEFNHERKQKNELEIAIGTGIHTGPLMLGILGESERMQGTVISDSVNLSARLETLTKQLSAYTLTSGETLSAMEFAEKISTRYVGKIRVKGKAQALKIYEILDGMPSRMKERRIQLKPHLHAVLKAYESGDMQELQKRLGAYPVPAEEEPVVAIIKSVIKSFGNKGFPEKWDGTITFDHK